MGSYSKKEMLAKIKAAVHSVDSAAEVILYGSRSRGDEREDSDWDILVVVDGDSSRKREEMFILRVMDLEIETGYCISVSLVSNEEYAFKKQFVPLLMNIDRERAYL